MMRGLKNLIHNEKCVRIGKYVLAAVLVSGAIAIAASAPRSISAKGYIYVDADAKGDMDGSSSKPYDSIQDAIDKAYKKNKSVYIKNGTYHENISIWKNVEVYGQDRDKVVIKAKDKSYETVKMYDNSEIWKVTIKDGDRGIKVRDWSSAVIGKCNIINNDKDGITAGKGAWADKHLLQITKNKIANNGWDGIFAENRKTWIVENEILDNGKDGVELQRSSRSYLEGNSIRNNGGDGMRLTIDGSNIWSKSNTYYDNGREGIEIKTDGQTGSIGIERSKFYKNDRYGIAKIEKFNFPQQLWDQSLTITLDNIFWANKDGNVSPVIIVD